MTDPIEDAGVSWIELTVCLGLLTSLAAAAVPNLLGMVDHLRAAGAAQYVAGQLMEARMQALARGASTAVRFSEADGPVSYSTYLDGNRNGVLSRDIAEGIDREIRGPQRLTDRLSGVDFGTLPGLPAVEAGGTPPGDDPIRVGSTRSITFTPAGTATPGSLYVRSAGNAQFVIRLFGETGRVRVLRFEPVRRQWIPVQ